MNKYWKNILIKDLTKKKEISQFRVLKHLEKSNGREIQINNVKLINFASNDYLGLTKEKQIIENGYKVSKDFGAGSGASRLVTGSNLPYNNLEKRLASWIGKESSLLFNTGYHANIGILSALADRHTVIFTDKLNHASIYDGMILSRALIARYPHNDMEGLKKLLYKHKDTRKKIIITDSIFSMEGDIADLKKIAVLAKENNALTIIDEAHSMGIFGKHGNGLVCEYDLADEIDIIMGTLGKSFGVFGAFAAADETLIEYLINICRPFIFTTALPPFVIGAVDKALDIIKEGKIRKKVLESSRYIREKLINHNINIGNSESQIIPVIVKTNENAVKLMEYLKDCGFYTPAIRPPTVPNNTSRIRLSVSSHHTKVDLDKISDFIIKWYKEHIK